MAVVRKMCRNCYLSFRPHRLACSVAPTLLYQIFFPVVAVGGISWETVCNGRRIMTIQELKQVAIVDEVTAVDEDLQRRVCKSTSSTRLQQCIDVNGKVNLPEVIFS
jgi:hypothetical protein